jgi:hypothetical protein
LRHCAFSQSLKMFVFKSNLDRFDLLIYFRL